MFTAIIVAVLVMAILRICSITTEPKERVLVANIFGGVRQAGPGWVLLLRPFEWIATVNDVKVHSVQKRALKVKVKVEARNKQSLTLYFLIDLRVINLMQYSDLTEEDLKESIKEYTESFATDIGLQCADLDEISEKVNSSNDFEARVLSGFKELMPSGALTIEAYHGVAVDSVVISDVELPEAVEQAALEKEVAKKRAEAQLEEIRGLDKSAKLLRGKGKNPSMEKEKALQIVQQQFGKVTKHNEEFGFAPDTIKTIEKVPGAGIPAWALAIFRQMGGGRGGGGKRGGGRDQKGGK